MATIPSTYSEFRAISIDQLISAYDEKAKSTVVGLNFIREEISRREAEERTCQMLAATRHMRNLTFLIAAMTAINVVTVVVALF